VVDVFVNYRTADAGYAAAACYDRLVDRFGENRIFRDCVSMLPGEVYPKAIKDALEQALVLVVLIGRGWLATGADGRLLVDRPDDWVRREIQRALERGITIVPVLLDGVDLPAAEVLPADIRGLAHRQAARVDQRTFGPDVRRLIEQLLAAEPGLAGSDAPPAHAGPPRKRRRHWMLALGTSVAAIVVLVGLLLDALGPNGRDSPPAGGSPTTGNFTAKSPWRLVIRDNIGSNNNGCDVTVKNTGTGRQTQVKGIYKTRTYQMQDSGSFNWQANDPGCLVVQHPGAGQAVLPFAQDRGGDTDAFQTHGKVAVEVIDFHGNRVCDLMLHDATDGRLLDFGTVPKDGKRLLLDPNGHTQVYLNNPYCGIHLSSA
jgi:hypothetical protein